MGVHIGKSRIIVDTGYHTFRRSVVNNHSLSKGSVSHVTSFIHDPDSDIVVSVLDTGFHRSPYSAEALVVGVVDDIGVDVVPVDVVWIVQQSLVAYILITDWVLGASVRFGVVLPLE